MQLLSLKIQEVVVRSKGWEGNRWDLLGPNENKFTMLTESREQWNENCVIRCNGRMIRVECAVKSNSRRWNELQR